jgi:zinc transporter, ZIP family
VRRALILLVVLIAVAAAAAIVRWPTSGGDDGEASVRTASLRPGQISLLLANDSENTTRVAQVILNDAFVDFRSNIAALKPGETARITIWYPWIAGESYDLQLMTATGATIGYEIEDAEAA